MRPGGRSRWLSRREATQPRGTPRRRRRVASRTVVTLFCPPSRPPVESKPPDGYCHLLPGSVPWKLPPLPRPGIHGFDRLDGQADVRHPVVEVRRDPHAFVPGPGQDAVGLQAKSLGLTRGGSPRSGAPRICWDMPPHLLRSVGVPRQVVRRRFHAGLSQRGAQEAKRTTAETAAAFEMASGPKTIPSSLLRSPPGASAPDSPIWPRRRPQPRSHWLPARRPQIPGPGTLVLKP